MRWFSILVTIRETYWNQCALGFGRFHYMLLTVCGLIYMDTAIGVTILSFVLPAAQCDLEMDSTAKGWLTASPMLGRCFPRLSYFGANSLHRRKSFRLRYFCRYVDWIIYMGMPGWHEGQEDRVNRYAADGRHRGRHVFVRSILLGVPDLPVLQRLRVSTIGQTLMNRRFSISENVYIITF